MNHIEACTRAFPPDAIKFNHFEVLDGEATMDVTARDDSWGMTWNGCIVGYDRDGWALVYIY